MPIKTPIVSPNKKFSFVSIVCPIETDVSQLRRVTTKGANKMLPPAKKTILRACHWILTSSRIRRKTASTLRIRTIRSPSLIDPFRSHIARVCIPQVSTELLLCCRRHFLEFVCRYLKRWRKRGLALVFCFLLHWQCALFQMCERLWRQERNRIDCLSHSRSFCRSSRCDGQSQPFNVHPDDAGNSDFPLHARHRNPAGAGL